MFFRIRPLFLFFATLLPLSLSAQSQEKQDSLVRLISAKSLQLIEKDGMNYRKVVGPATFLHNDTYLICDTALWNVDTRVIDAIGNVRILQEQTELTSDKMVYYIDTDLAEFRGSLVQLQDKDRNTLRTRNLDYNTKDSVAVFRQGGSMRDKDGQIIESDTGTYDSKIKTFTFTSNVNMFSDSVFVATSRLKYESDLDLATFGAGTNAWKDKNMLSADAGWYDKGREVFFFNRNVHVMSETQEGWCDTLYFYRAVSDVEMLGNAQVTDTTRNVSAVAGRIEYIDSLSRVTLTREPAVITETEQDGVRDTVYFGADTLVYLTVRMCDIDSLTIAESRARLTNLDVDPVSSFRKKAAEEAAKRAEEASRDDPNNPDNYKKQSSGKPPINSAPAGVSAGVSPGASPGKLSEQPPGLSQPVYPAGPPDSLAVPSDSSAVFPDSAAVSRDSTVHGNSLKAFPESVVPADSVQIRSDTLTAASDSAAMSSDSFALVPPDFKTAATDSAATVPADSSDVLSESSSVDSVSVRMDSLSFSADSLALSDSLDVVSDSLAVELDTTKIGFVTALRNVRIYKSNMQVVCDSLLYSDLDSLARLFVEPVIWDEITRQYSSDSIIVVIRNNMMEKASLMSNAFILMQEDTVHYNQIKGAEMLAFFDENSKLKRFDALGGSAALFYIEENDVLATVNKKEAKMLSAVFNEGNIDRIFYFDAAKSDAYPVVQISEEDRKLKGFNWQPARRPKDRTDITTIALRGSERTRYEDMPRARYRQTDIYFPGYISDVYHQISVRDSLKIVRNRERRIAEQRRLDSLAFASDSLALADSLFKADSLFLADSIAVADSLFRADSIAVADSLFRADSIAVADSLAGRVLSREELREQKKAEREKRRAERIAAKNARWEKKDLADEEKQKAREAARQEKIRRRTMKEVERLAEQNRKDQELLEKYKARLSKKLEKQNARKARKSAGKSHESAGGE